MRVITLGSGAGQTGKSFVAANLGAALASRGLRTCLVDLDMAGADLHLLSGCLASVPTVVDLLRNRVSSLRDAMTSLHPSGNLHLIPGPRESLRSSGLSQQETNRLGTEILRLPADVVIIDFETGVSQPLLDLFLIGDYQWVVTTERDDAIEASASFLRRARLRRTAKGSASGQIERRPRIYTSLDDLVKDMNALRGDQLPTKDGISICPGLILNRCGRDGAEPGKQLSETLFQSIEELDDFPVLAEIPEDSCVASSCSSMKPLVSSHPEAPASLAISQLASSLSDEVQATSRNEEAASLVEPALI